MKSVLQSFIENVSDFVFMYYIKSISKENKKQKHGKKGLNIAGNKKIRETKPNKKEIT